MPENYVVVLVLPEGRLISGYVEASGPSQAVGLAVEGLHVDDAMSVLEARAMKMADIPKVTFPKVEVKW